jgi:hypothetical protein
MCSGTYWSGFKRLTCATHACSRRAFSAPPTNPLRTHQGLPASVRTGGRPNREEALQAVAVINRVRRLLGSISDATVARVAPFATALGRSAGCDPWAVDIFAEEVVRVSWRVGARWLGPQRACAPGVQEVAG